MSVADAILANTDPVTALLIIFLWVYIRRDNRLIRRRLRRLEGTHFVADGGEEVDGD